ncbi:hydroxyacylglutathione hydrolase [Synechococcus sp. PCC 7336]|uniref:hydroxyacylglutathione hydrolase n=1 Tax=Synechococcus sp. PCC 7336 TaxID=195250 RepID=UPI0003635588|nr:hydroxyacylglutathione hydrolase [Synechococcus sp. PCC 7336]
MDVFRLPVLSDNYVFLLFDPSDRTAAVVDPAVAEPVLAKLQELDATLIAIFNTHHHFDHVGGNRDLLARYPDTVVYGSSVDRQRIPGIQVKLQDGDRVQFGGETAEVLFVPGHTRGHIAYYFPTAGHLFCGDTLFAGGCGRLFEGTPAQMLQSLDRLRHLPDTTQIWCAHEYTLKNLQFAITVDGDNTALQVRLRQVRQARSQNKPTIPSTIGLEKRTNPFLRWDCPALKTAAKIEEPNRVFARIRGMKDRF